MIRRLFNFLTAAAVLSFFALLILTIPSFMDPEFKVINNASEAVSVVAVWRDRKKNIGNIDPMSSIKFSVDDEAAMTFRVHYISGTEIETEPLYFTSGIKVIVTISQDDIEVRYDQKR